jgi:hypothetical protein
MAASSSLIAKELFPAERELKAQGAAMEMAVVRPAQ